MKLFITVALMMAAYLVMAVVIRRRSAASSPLQFAIKAILFLIALVGLALMLATGK